MSETDADIRDILTSVKTIAVVGWSPNPERPSHRVAAFLRSQGYRVIPVNPGVAGQDAGHAAPVAASLSEIGEPVDMVDIFRRSGDVPPVVDEALTLPGLQAIWMQLGIEHVSAAEQARAAGVRVVQNRCPAIDIPRLGLLR